MGVLVSPTVEVIADVDEVVVVVVPVSTESVDVTFVSVTAAVVAPSVVVVTCIS